MKCPYCEKEHILMSNKRNPNMMHQIKCDKCKKTFGYKVITTVEIYSVSSTELV